MPIDSARGVVFDLDGVLVDSEPLWKEAIVALVNGYGCAYSEEVAEGYHGQRQDDVARVIVRGYGLDASAADVSATMIDLLLEHFERSLAPMPGADEAMAVIRAAGAKIAIATSSPRRVLEWVVERFGWQLDATSSADEVPNGKPAPDVYLHAAKSIAVRPCFCLAIEDTQIGARSARAAGMTCLMLPGDLDTLFDLRADHLV